MRGQRPTTARLDLGALADNYAEARRRAEGRDVIAVVKADAYGHGASVVARRLVAAGCRRLAVLTVEEAAALREAAIAVPILVLEGVHGPADADSAMALRTTPVVHHEGQIDWLSEAARKRDAELSVQVEIDTGMRRMGVSPDQACSLLERVVHEGGLTLDGVYTHLARADESDPAPTREQLERFAAVLGAARARGIRPGRVHVANSGALLAAARWGPDVLMGDAVRPGLMLYGVSPAAHLDTAGLRPVMTLRSCVVQVRRIARRDAVGYGATYRARRPGWIATLPIGYADGFPWSAGNRAEVLLRGRRCPVAGRVSMDFVTVALGDQAVELGEEAIVFGAGQGTHLPVEEAAAAAGTIPYELLVRVGARVPRVVLG